MEAKGVFLNGGRVGGLDLKFGLFAFNKPVHFNRSSFLALKCFF